MVDLSSLAAFRRRRRPGFDPVPQLPRAYDGAPVASVKTPQLPMAIDADPAEAREADEEVSVSYGYPADEFRPFAPLDDEDGGPAADLFGRSDQVDKLSIRSVSDHHAEASPARPVYVPFVPKPGPGVTIREPAIEISAAEYDAHLDKLIAAAGAGTNEAGRLAAVKRKGSVAPRGEGWIFTRGRA